MKKLIFGLVASALVSAAVAADGSGAAAGTTTTPAVGQVVATTVSATAPATAGSKAIDPVKAAMGDGPCCTDGSCGEPMANKVFLSPRAAQLASRRIKS